jgi:4-carboxymuconolactone decarboxylase
MHDAYFHRSHLPQFGTVGRGNQKLADLFFAYYGEAFADGALSARMKSLTALAVAHAVQCPYCIDAYTGDSLEKGADLEQMAEAVHIAAWVRGGSVLDYGAMMVAQAGARTGTSDAPNPASYFSRGHGDARASLAAGPFAAWEDAVRQEGELEAVEKAIIAVAIAHVLQNPYAIERGTAWAVDEGASVEQLTEAIHVGVAIRGGAALVHAVQMLEQLDQRGMA